MSVSYECCVLSGGGLCIRVIARPRRSATGCGVSGHECKASIMRGAWPTGGLCAMRGRGEYGMVI